MINRIAGPEAFTPAHVDIKQPEKVLLDNKVEAFFFNAGDQEVCKIELIFPGGKYVESIGGASFFTLKMLLEGSEKYSSTEISDFFDYHGAFLEFTSTLDDNQAILYCRSEHIGKLLPVFAEIIFNPKFTDDKLLKLKERQAQQLKINLQKTSYWATKLFRGELYGVNHPYGKLLGEEDIQHIEVSDLYDYHKQFLVASQFDLIVSGKFDTTTTFDLLNLYLGQHITKSQKINTKPALNNPNPFTLHKLNDSNQASLKLGCKSLNRQDAQYPLLALSNKILGGYFGSRLMKVIREEKGLTYGIYSGLGHFSHESFFQVGADVKKDAWELVVELVKEEISKLRDTVIGEEELSLVKNFMIGEFQNEINTTFDLSTKFKMLRYSNLDVNYYNHFYDQIGRATSEEVLSTMRQYIDPMQLTIVAVQ